MINGVGIDMFKIDRVDIENIGLVKRILGEKEFEVFLSLTSNRRKQEYVASRFAVKEALVKAFNDEKIVFKKINVLNNEKGVPYVVEKDVKVSISHEKEYVIAIVIR